MKIWTPWLLAGLAVGCSGNGSNERANFLCVVVDSLRADEVSPDRTPNLDALGRTGVRFERAYAASSWNMPAVASLLTGLRPSEHGVARIDDSLGSEHETLASALARAGYATSAVVSDFRLGRARGFDRGFQAFDDDAAGGDGIATTAAVIAKASKELERLSQHDRPFFLLVHLYDPHAAYLDRDGVDWADPAGTSLRGGESAEELCWIGPAVTEVEARFVRDLHAEEVWAADRGVGQLLAELGELGHDDDTLVVAVGSHGQELFDRGKVGSATSLHEEQIRVPLLIRAPWSAHRVVTDAVSTASIAATVLGAAGQPSIGRAGSLAAFLHGHPRVSEAVVSEIDYEPPLAPEGTTVLRQRAIVEKRFKLIHDALTGTTELYDLRVDPRERTNIARSYPLEVARLRDELERQAGPLVFRR